MLTIGLTGGIGSGKSVVARMLADLGAVIVDADKVGHAIYQPGAPAYAALVAEFGERILAADKTIDRKKLGSIVFSDPAALKALNSIVHPKMFEQMRDMIAQTRSRGERVPIVIEAAILIEANWHPLCDEIWLVTASPDLVTARMQSDRGLKPAETEARIRAQLPDSERRRYATVEINNNGTLDELRIKVAQLWAKRRGRNG